MPGQCKVVAKAVKDIASAARSSVAGGTRIQKISNFLGKEGQKNGVVIKAGADKDLGNAMTEHGITTLNVNFRGADSTDKVSSVITHEVSHGLDQKAREKQGLYPMTTSRTDLNVSELNANLTEAKLFEALGRDSPYGMWTRKGGVIMKRSTLTQTDRLDRYVPKWFVIPKLHRAVFATLLVALPCGSCAAQTRTAELTVNDVIRSSRQYDGKSVLVDACLNVTRHTMTLVDCRKPAGEIAFGSTQGNEADYQAIVDAGFKSLGAKNAQVGLKLVGKFGVLEGPYSRYFLSVEDVLTIKELDE